jgi:hypothetical protein
MRSNLKFLTSALAVAVVAFSLPASASTSSVQRAARHHASVQRAFQPDVYGSAVGPSVRYGAPYAGGRTFGAGPDANIWLDSQRDPGNDR